jgi:hypothetical protein
VDRFAGERRELGRAAEEMQLRKHKKKTAPEYPEPFLFC